MTLILDSITLKLPGQKLDSYNLKDLFDSGYIMCVLQSSPLGIIKN
jgi:hypothetical protein